MTKEQLIDRYAQTLKSYIGTGLAKDECVGLIKNAVNEALTLYGVSGMFSEKHLIQAYNDGMEAEQQRCDNFDIENYR